MLHNLFIWFVIILMHKIITGHIWKVPAPLHFWEYSPSLAFGERWKQNAWLWTQMSICFPSKSTATTSNAKKIHHHHSKRIHHCWGIGVIKTFGQCPLQPRFFSHGSFSLSLGDGVDSKSSVRQMAICGGEGCFSSVASVCTTVPKLD